MFLRVKNKNDYQNVKVLNIEFIECPKFSQNKMNLRKHIDLDFSYVDYFKSFSEREAKIIKLLQKLRCR